MAIKTTPDREKAESLVKLAKLRLQKIPSFNLETESTLIIEYYYEIIKEILTAKLFLKGRKAIDHIELIEENKNTLTEEEVKLIHQLRKIRNNITYRGIFIDKNYIIRNESQIEKIIDKLLQKKSKTTNHQN